jgi:Tol biopolymer transport system component
MWVDRQGAIEPLPVPPQAYMYPRISPDGRKVVVMVARLNCDAMVLDIGRDTLDRLTFVGDNHAPTWTPDGKRIAFESRRKDGFTLFWKPADASGPDEQLAGSEHQTDGISSLSWAPNGKVLAYEEFHTDTGRDIWLLSLDGDHKARPFLQSAFNEHSPAFSPDGRWLAYVSDESGRFEIYVQPFPGPGGKWLISTGGGTEPVWNRNGRELFYRSGEKMMAVEIVSQPRFSPARPKVLFEKESPATYANLSNYDVLPDGKRFLMVQNSEQEATHINVVLDWFEELKRRVPTR